MAIAAGTHLRVAIPFDAEGFNEVWRNYTGAGGYFVANNIYSRLVVLDVFGAGDIGPDLAERWDILDGGSTYIFYLNPKARWEDGTPLTAHDVVYTYQEVLEHGYHGLSWLQDIQEIRATDDHTVECKLKEPNAGFLALLGSFVFSHIVPKHLYEGTNWDENPHNWEPIGSGPFKFERWVKGERIDLVANPDYWGEGPYVERLTYYVMPSAEEAHRALEQGEIDFSIFDIPASATEEWRAKPGIEVVAESGNSIGFLSFNWAQERFQDRRVREAIARAVVRKEIAEAIYPPIPTPNHYYLQKIDWAFNPAAVAPEFDPDQAAALLDEAGFAPDADGVRMRLRIASRGLYAHYGTTAQVLKSQLANLGIVVEVQELSPVEWQERMQQGGDWDLMLEAGDIGPDPQQMASFLASDGPRNVSGYANATVDECFRAGKAATDRQERGEHYKQLQATLAEDIARIPLLQYGEYMPYSESFTGWSWAPGVRGTVPFWYHGKVRPV